LCDDWIEIDGKNFNAMIRVSSINSIQHDLYEDVYQVWFKGSSGGLTNYRISEDGYNRMKGILMLIKKTKPKRPHRMIGVEREYDDGQGAIQRDTELERRDT